MDKDKKRMDPTGLIRRAFIIHGKGFMTLKTLLSFLDRAGLDLLGLSRDSTQGAVESAISLLKRPYHIRKYGSSKVIFNAPLEEVALAYIAEKDGKTFGQLNKDFPVTTSVFLDIVNGLLDREQLKARLSKTAKPLLYPFENKKVQIPTSPEKKPAYREAFQAPASDSFTISDFKSAYDAAGKGANYVFIHRIRRHLGWPRKLFDDMLYRMMVEGYLAAHPGNPAELAPDEIADSFRDEFGDLYITVTWRKPL